MNYFPMKMKKLKVWVKGAAIKKAVFQFIPNDLDGVLV